MPHTDWAAMARGMEKLGQLGHMKQEVARRHGRLRSVKVSVSDARDLMGLFVTPPLDLMIAGVKLEVVD